MARGQREWPRDELGQSAVIFAPHQDDEVLGCGGTIMRKLRAGAAVTVVFMTDGSASHPDLMAGDEMKRLRAAEALAACRILGLSADRVLFLELKDGHLSNQHDEAVQRVRDILQRLRPAQVFIPHYHDGSPDHLATTKAVLTALRAERSTAVVCEYPVWLWCYWPWIGLGGKLSDIPEGLRRSTVANRCLRCDCRSFVPIGDLLDLKRAALAAHKSQVERLLPDRRWFILGDVANGDFLACFFQDREIFYCHAPWEGEA
jgi:LmbE family N-acetylglucosaminyl deacetylase